VTAGMLGAVLRWTWTTAAAVACAGCLGGGSGDAPSTSRLALEWEADPAAVRLVGLFAFDANQPGLRCESYVEGDFDPFVEGEPAGITFFPLQGLGETDQLLDGITTGSRLILAEAYDAGGARIFLGCDGPVPIEAGERAEVTIALVPDPSL